MDRIIEITSNNRHLAVERGSMAVFEDGKEIGRVPFDQIGAVIANAHGLTYSNNFLVRLAEQKAPLVICGANHVPVSVLLPLEGNYLQSSIMSAQAAMKETTLNRYWKEVVRAKIRQQAAVLDAFGLESKILKSMALKVRSGDSENMEGQAARYYFQTLFGKSFRRDRTQTGINALLNYGYTILRSSVIRSVVAAGLHPSLGLHHCNQYNPMCLADDLMEPFRPMIDFCVRRLVGDGCDSVTADAKKRLVSVLSCSMPTDKGSREISYVINDVAVSLAKCARGESDTLNFPSPMSDLALWGI